MKAVIICKFKNSNYTLMDVRGNKIKVVMIQNQKKVVTPQNLENLSGMNVSGKLKRR